ncbi:MAG: hypothetical protein AAEJ52_05185, partial [Myxococcota bacterium]
MNLGEIFYTFDHCALQVRKDLLLPDPEVVAFTMSDIAKIEPREPRRSGALRQRLRTLLLDLEIANVDPFDAFFADPEAQ